MPTAARQPQISTSKPHNFIPDNNLVIEKKTSDICKLRRGVLMNSLVKVWNKFRRQRYDEPVTLDCNNELKPATHVRFVGTTIKG